ncbi:MAG: amino acid racemase [Bacillota bacterium]|nr:amino acid racemase [Bacillota bacterium]
MEHKLLGILGGMGPKATSVFFDKIIEYTISKRDQDHIDILILNHATLPDRTSTILEHREEQFLELIEKDIRLFELAGVSNIAIPCNTTHFFHSKMQEMTEINIINMVNETIKEIYAKYGESSKIGILATNGTINSGVYSEECKKYNLELHVPEEAMQEKVMKIIYEDVKGDLDADPTELEAIINELVYKENCVCVILACTELSCIQISYKTKKYCIDAMEVLIKKSIILSGKKYGKELESR